MKAIVHDKYGPPDLLRLEEVAKPVPGDNQALIKVIAASVNRSDWEGLVGKPLYARLGGLLRPGRRIPGSDVAGRVEAVGRNVTLFQPGDEVFGLLTTYSGGFAEYACASEKALALKPAGLTFEQAAAIPQAGLIALQGIRTKGKVQAGQQVLINGAGGAAGMFAIQLAKSAGAEVTGVDNAGKLDFMRSLGADHVIDYTREDFTRSRKEYDLVLDVIAYRSVFAYRRVVKPGGNYFFVGGSVATAFQLLLLGSWIRRRTGRNLRVLAVATSGKELVQLAELCEAGEVVLAIDRHYPLRDVPEALRYLGEGRARGKLVITVAGEDGA
jgi:NADPH:quinone reductase-like Zn-dependent oxidoreductase